MCVHREKARVDEPLSKPVLEEVVLLVLGPYRRSYDVTGLRGEPGMEKVSQHQPEDRSDNGPAKLVDSGCVLARRVGCDVRPDSRPGESSELESAGTQVKRDPINTVIGWFIPVVAATLFSEATTRHFWPWGLVLGVSAFALLDLWKEYF